MKKPKYTKRKAAPVIPPATVTQPALAQTPSRPPMQNLRQMVYLLSFLVTAMMLYSAGVFYRSQKSNKRQIVQVANYEGPKYILTTQIPTPTIAAVHEPIYLPVLTYHYVEYDRDLRDWKRVHLTTHPDILEAQFETLQKNKYHTYFAREMPLIMESKTEFYPKSIVLTFDDGYQDFYTTVFPLLKKYNLHATQYVIYNDIGRKGFLSQAQIRELIDSGLVEIGSHTLDHLYLKTLPDAQARVQIVESKTKLEKMFGIKVETFCYPAGGFNENTLKMVNAAGYTTALTTLPGVYHRRDDIYLIRRIRTAAYGEALLKALAQYRLAGK